MVFPVAYFSDCESNLRNKRKLSAARRQHNLTLSFRFILDVYFVSPREYIEDYLDNYISLYHLYKIDN